MIKRREAAPFDAIVTSRQNAHIRRARETRAGKNPDMMFIEGLRLCEEAARARIEIHTVLYSEKFIKDERSAALIRTLSDNARAIVVTSDELINHLSDTRTPQGVIALARRPPTGIDLLESKTEKAHLLVILHRINNPSNAGAILRVAEAAGATGVIATRNTSDIFSPKSLRGSMGSAFRLPVCTDADYSETLSWCEKRGIATVTTSLEASATHTEFDWTNPCAVVLGSEATGLNAIESRASAHSIRIPMSGGVESLNVAVALAVVMYEAARQRDAFQSSSNVMNDI